MKLSLLIISIASLCNTCAFSPVHPRLQIKQADHNGCTVSSKSSSLSFFNNKKIEPELEPVAIAGVGVEGCALPSLSKVNTQSEPIQAAIVLGIFAALGISSVAFSSFLDIITLKYEWVQTWRYTWPLLGAIYAIAGVTHFTVQKEYENIYPSKGAWGIWYLPGTPEFHVKWTGIAEILGGLGLLVGGAYDAFMPVFGECPNVITSAGIGSDAAGKIYVVYLNITICILTQKDIDTYHTMHTFIYTYISCAYNKQLGYYF